MAYEEIGVQNKEIMVNVSYAFQENQTYKDQNGVEKSVITYEEPRWTFKNTSENLEIIKSNDAALYAKIQNYVREQELPSENLLYFDFGKLLRYDNEYSKETLEDKLDNRFIVRYSHDNDEGNLVNGGDEIILKDKEIVNRLNEMIKNHVQENIAAYETYEQLQKENSMNEELTGRIEKAFEVAKNHYVTPTIKLQNNYSEHDKEKFIKGTLSQIGDFYDNGYENKTLDLEKGLPDQEGRIVTYEEIEALILARDVFDYGEDALNITRPNAEQIKDGFDNLWGFGECTTGYAEFQSIPGSATFISRIDDMMVFHDDFDAATAWARDHNGSILEEKRDIWIGDGDMEYYQYPDTPENREILKDYLLDHPLEFDWDGFNKKRYDNLKNEILSGNVTKGYKGTINIGSIAICLNVADKESERIKYDFFVLGDEGEKGENINGIPFNYVSGGSVPFFYDYAEFQDRLQNELLDFVADNGYLKKEAMRENVDWGDEDQTEDLYQLKLDEQESQNLLPIFENASVKIDLTHIKDSALTISLKNGKTIELKANGIAERELDDYWHGFEHNGKEFDINVFKVDDGFQATIYGVDAQGSTDTLHGVFIKDVDYIHSFSQINAAETMRLRNFKFNDDIFFRLTLNDNSELKKVFRDYREGDEMYVRAEVPLVVDYDKYYAMKLYALRFSSEESTERQKAGKEPKRKDVEEINLQFDHITQEERVKLCEEVSAALDEYMERNHGGLTVYEAFTTEPKPAKFFRSADELAEFMNQHGKTDESEPDISVDTAKAVLYYNGYSDYKLYADEKNNIYILDVSEDFSGEGKLVSNEDILEHSLDCSDSAALYSEDRYNEAFTESIKAARTELKEYKNVVEVADEIQNYSPLSDNKVSEEPQPSKQEFDELKKNYDSLLSEKNRLTNENIKLTSENNSLKGENKSLTDENARLMEQIENQRKGRQMSGMSR